MQQRRLILDNIRSAHNVGSIFRTADAAAVERIYLCGITPTPADRFGRIQPQIAKTSLGATTSVAWEQIGDGTTRATAATLSLVTQLKAEGFSVVAVEQRAGAVALYTFQAPAKVAYILGAEVEGVQPELLSAVDATIEIPMAGVKESLNVSVAAGIVLFQRSS